MRVMLDGQPVPVGEPTLRAALDAARDAAGALGRVIVEAKVDGRAVPDELLESPTDESISGAELVFVTAEPRALVRTTLLEIADVLGRVGDVQTRAAVAFQRGDREEALGHLSDVLGVWDTVRRAVQEGPALLGIPLEQFLVSKGTAAPGERDSRAEHILGHIGALSDLLSAVKRSIQGQDWSSLADLLETELAGAAERWQQILKDMAAHIGQRK